MLELLLELITSSLGFFASDNDDNAIDVTTNKMESDSKVLATSPLRDEKGEPGSSSQPTDSKKPKGDSEICKELTDRVTDAQKASFKPIVILEEINEEGRKNT